MTEDVFVLDCHSDIFVWVGQEVDAKVKSQAMNIGEVKPKLSSIVQLVITIFICFSLSLSL